MTLRYYANSPATTLAASCTNSSTSITVTSATGFPIQYPYTLILDRGQATEEGVSVTAAAGAVLTVTRGIDGTTAFAHSLGAVVEHGILAQDIREANAHVNATSGVHGGAGAVVDTVGAQVLTNKDLSSATNTLAADVVHTTSVQTLTNKTLTTPDIAAIKTAGVSTVDLASAGGADHLSVANGAGRVKVSGSGTANLELASNWPAKPYVTDATVPANEVATVGSTQTLTNKDMSSITNTPPVPLLITKQNTETLYPVTTGVPVILAVTYGGAIPFASPPTVQVTLNGPSSNLPQNFSWAVSAVTATGFNLIGVRTAGAAGSMQLSWTAIGPR